MTIEIDENNLKQGLLGLVVALVEIIEEVLERQAIRRMDGGSLSDDEVERLGASLCDLREALENIKADNGLEDAVDSVRNGLDNVAEEFLTGFVQEEQADGR
jgi:hypothetical protein